MHLKLYLPPAALSLFLICFGLCGPGNDALVAPKAIGFHGDLDAKPVLSAFCR